MNESTIEIELPHDSALNDFNDFKHELLAWLHQKLENSSLEIEPKVLVEEDSKVKAYTSRDKLDVLFAKNEKLKEFIKKLDLSPDF
jgi:DNA polymerase III subunit gamma/tau